MKIKFKRITDITFTINYENSSADDVAIELTDGQAKQLYFELQKKYFCIEKMFKKTWYQYKMNGGFNDRIYM